MIIKTPKGNLLSSQNAMLDSNKAPILSCPLSWCMYHKPVGVVSLDTIFPMVPTRTKVFSGQVIISFCIFAKS